MIMINLNVLEGVNHTVCYEISMLETQQTRKEYRIRKFRSNCYGLRSILLRISINTGFRFLRYQTLSYVMYTWKSQNSYTRRVYVRFVHVYIPTQVFLSVTAAENSQRVNKRSTSALVDRFAHWLRWFVHSQTAFFTTHSISNRIKHEFEIDKA